MQETYKINIETDIGPGNVIEQEDLRVLLFESARELLFNVVKHAGATSARLKMTQTETGTLRITVSDQGVGFDSGKLMQELGRNDCFGLFSIRERLELIGGRLEIESSQGNGAAFNLLVPVKRQD
jgi:signal transduction histidine kinase